jgi:hypothetical protein
MATFVLPDFKFISATTNVYLRLYGDYRSGFYYGAVMIFHYSVLASCGSHPTT